jgi:tetratricopeptide (TPR) repeat protein
MEANLGNLGLAYAALGDARKIIEYYEEALKIAREIGDRYGEANNCLNLGLEYEKAGDIERAVDLKQAWIKFERDLGHPEAEKDDKYLKNV